MDAHEIQKKAEQVARSVREHEDAIHEERTARAKLLEAVIRAVKPALRGLGSRIATHREGRVDYGENAHATIYHEKKGLYLSDVSPGPVEERPYRDMFSGDHGGYDLFLLTDGTLVRLDYSGTWSCWQGRCWFWDAEVATITPMEVVEMGEDEGAIHAIEKAIDRELAGKRENSTVRARKRAEQLRAVATLL